jgi:Tfp pilus assembly protein FimT
MSFAGRKVARAACTLVEIVIVTVIIALLAASALPGFLRARKRSQTAHSFNHLPLSEPTADPCAIEESKETCAPIDT